MICTSNFANNQRHNLSGISISRYPATRQGFTGPEFPPLMPSAQLLKWYKENPDNWLRYTHRYNEQLRCLSAEVVKDQLEEMANDHNNNGDNDGETPVVLLCYESAKTLDTQPCHRRLVAAWFERELGVVVPEWSKEVAA